MFCGILILGNSAKRSRVLFVQIGSNYSLPSNYVTVNTVIRSLNGWTESNIMKDELFKRASIIIDQYNAAQNFGISGLTISELQAKLLMTQTMLAGVTSILERPSQESIQNDNQGNLNAGNGFKVENR